MARKKTIKISGVNIVTQPHSPEDYIWLFKEILKSRKYVQVYGKDCLMLADFDFINKKNPLDGIIGSFIKFTKIDEDSDWVNLSTASIIEPNDTPKLNPNLQPNGSKILFVFYPQGKNKAHKLFFISSSRDSAKGKLVSLSPNLVKKFFDIVTQSKDFAKFKSIKTTVLPSSSALENVLALHFIKRLEIVIFAPNPDMPDFKRDMMQRLNDMNAQEYKEILISDGQSIVPDEKLKKDAKIASTNGYVKSVGKDSNNISDERSTIDQPLNEVRIIDSKSIDAERFELLDFKYGEH